MKKQVDVSIATCNEFFKLLKNFACYELIAISGVSKLPQKKCSISIQPSFERFYSFFSHSLKEKSQNNSLKPFCFSLETKYEKNVI